MRWSKLKNIILFLLVMVNLSLLVIVGARLWQSEQSDRELRERMLIILERNGIEFLPEEVPGDMPLTARQLTLSSLGKSQAAFLVNASGEAFSSAGGILTFQGELGDAVFFSDGSLDVRFAPGACPLKGRSLSETCGSLLSGLGLDGQESARQEESVTFIQFWKGVPVPQAALTLTSRDGFLDRLYGRVLTGNDTGREGEYLSASTALTRFLEDLQKESYVCSQITALYPGYVLSGNNPVALTPAWYLETDAGWRCCVNAVTGSVRVEEASGGAPSK